MDLFYFDFVLFKNDLCDRSERFSGRRFICCTHPIIPIRPKLFPQVPPDVVSFGIPRTTPLAAPQTLPQTPPSPPTTESTSTSTGEPQTTSPQTINTSPAIDPNLQTTTQINVPTTSDPLPQTTLQITPEPSPQSTTPPVSTIVVSTANSTASNSTDMPCSDARGFDGFCCNLNDCPTLNVALTKKYFFTYNDEYRVYIQQSTSICISHSEDFICCPKKKNSTDSSDSATTTPTTTTTKTTVAPPEPNIPFGRLLTPSEGCGYSNITHKRIADGNLAEPGIPASLFNNSMTKKN